MEVINKQSSSLVIFLVFMAYIPLLMASSLSHVHITPTMDESQSKVRHFLSHRAVEYVVNTSLQHVFNRYGNDGLGDSGLARIERSILHTFQSMPKNGFGRLAPRAVRHIVHNYFAKEHGWLIKGLEARHQVTSTEVHEMQILQERAPALVEALLGEHTHSHGFALGDVVAMVAALEQLIFDESVELLHTAYALNFKSTSERLSMDDLYEVLMSYLYLYESGPTSAGHSPEEHQSVKKMVHEADRTIWQDLKVFADDSVRNYNWQKKDQLNPFTQPHHSFDKVVSIVEGMAVRYGKFQNSDCLTMKEELMSLDIHGHGSVSLKNFYSQPPGMAHAFEESVEYLRGIGALDETLPNEPRVRIANYVIGPSNCVAHQTYYAVCCLSECEGLMSELEAQVQAPLVSPDRLVDLVRNQWSSSVDAPRNLSEQLVDKLHQIAARSKGAVPLHGRLFAQWMHYAFPNECPFPQLTTNTTVFAASSWADGRHVVSEVEKHQHMSANVPAKCMQSAADCTSRANLAEWSDEEVLPTFPDQRHSAMTTMARFAVLVAVLLTLLRATSVASEATSSVGANHKQDEPRAAAVFV